ncbi:MAG: AraC family ligand binding domain-containing protein, partial [Planctomycetes bacterium]|nr:AraC family ligand binding domain-containing protein [Planctomycetota bacterium]
MSGGAAPSTDLLQMLRPFVRHCGDERRPAWRLRRRRLLDHLVVFIADGRGRFEIGPETIPVRPGDLLWIPPDTDHEMEGFAPGMNCPYLHGDLAYRPGVGDWDFSIPGGTTDLARHAHLMHPILRHPALDGLPGLHRGQAARRATTTAACKAMGVPLSKVRWDDRLYAAPVEDLLAALADCPKSA